MGKVKSPFLVNTFGDEILNRGFTAVPNVMLDHQKELKLSDNEMLFFIKTFRMNGRRVSENELGMKSKHTTIWRMKNSLKSKGYLKTQEIYSHSEKGKIKCLGTVFNWTGMIEAVGFILKQQSEKEILPFQNEIARAQIETAPAQIELADSKTKQTLKTSSKTLSKISSKSEEGEDAAPNGAMVPSHDEIPFEETDAGKLWEAKYQKDKSIGLLPLPSDKAGTVIYFKQGKEVAKAIVKEDGLQAAMAVFKFAYGNKYCQPVKIGFYKTYKARYMAENGGIGETPDDVNRRVAARIEKEMKESGQ